MDVKLVRRALLIAVALVVVLLIYAYFSAGGGVLDASNSEDLSAQFDALNPGIAGTNGGNPGSDDSDPGIIDTTNS